MGFTLGVLEQLKFLVVSFAYRLDIQRHSIAATLGLDKRAAARAASAPMRLAAAALAKMTTFEGHLDSDRALQCDRQHDPFDSLEHC